MSANFVFFFQRSCHTFLEGVSEADLFAELGPKSMAAPGNFKIYSILFSSCVVLHVSNFLLLSEIFET